MKLLIDAARLQDSLNVRMPVGWRAQRIELSIPQAQIESFPIDSNNQVPGLQFRSSKVSYALEKLSLPVNACSLKYEAFNADL